MITRFRDLKEYEAFRIEGVNENLVKRGSYALRYNDFGVFLGKPEITDETEVDLARKDE